MAHRQAGQSVKPGNQSSRETVTAGSRSPEKGMPMLSETREFSRTSSLQVDPTQRRVARRWSNGKITRKRRDSPPLSAPIPETARRTPPSADRQPQSKERGSGL